MQAASFWLGLFFIGLLIVAVVQLVNGSVHSAFVAAAWSFASLCIVLGFTWEVQCGVIGSTTNRPCFNEAYGFLFGCRKAPHFYEKFYARIGLRRPRSARLASMNFPPAASSALPCTFPPNQRPLLQAASNISASTATVTQASTCSKR